uniref:Uncharacterized protein n=1 Tax=Globodera rostochiensis TaxID=31243 RepID=A0A914H7M0_GLORO
MSRRFMPTELHFEIVNCLPVTKLPRATFLVCAVYSKWGHKAASVACAYAVEAFPADTAATVLLEFSKNEAERLWREIDTLSDEHAKKFLLTRTLENGFRKLRIPYWKYMRRKTKCMKSGIKQKRSGKRLGEARILNG